MDKITVKIKRLHPDAVIPTMGTIYAAGIDFYSVEDVDFAPGQWKIVPTGLAMELPPGKVCLIRDRSSMGFKGIHHFAGVIDSDYRGEYKILLCNHGSEAISIKKGDKVAQGIIQDYYAPEFEEVDELSDAPRGDGGFGSVTGR